MGLHPSKSSMETRKSESNSSSTKRQILSKEDTLSVAIKDDSIYK